jgi:hypothetical protein
MPVSVSLKLLVTTPGTQPLWPEGFVGLMNKLDEELTQNSIELTQYKVIADWCQEHDEHELASAFVWLSKRKGTRPLLNRIYGADEWAFSELPAAVRATGDVEGDVSTLAGAVAVLAERLRRVREALE